MMTTIHHADVMKPLHPGPFGRWPQSSSKSSEDVHQAAVQFVSSALVAPTLAVLQDSSLRPTSGPFAQTSAEKRFAPLLQMHLSDHITKAGNFKLVSQILERVGVPTVNETEVYG